MPKYAMVIDLEQCYGCRACMVACKIENNTPYSHLWMYVFRLEDGDYPNTEVTFLARPCMHCDNAPCVKVCPVGARYKEETGITAMDWDRCIGCRYCEVACPYGVNYFNWQDPKKNQYLDWDDPDIQAVTGGADPAYANPDLEGRYGQENRHIAGANHHKGAEEKCTFCIQRVEKGLDPACVANCPAFALKFGDLDDPESEPSKLLGEKPSFRLEEELDTNPRVYYVGGSHPSTEVRQIETIRARE